jgi:ABC-type glycerol-3-phosphate transport system permease component
MRFIRLGLFRIALWALLLLTLFPILWVVLTSIKPADISQALPPVWSFRPTLSNYRDVLGGNTYTSQSFSVLLVHSAVVTIASTLLGLAVGIPAAYSLARVKFRGKRFTANWILSTIMFPPAVSVVPVFIIASRLGLMDTFPVLVILNRAGFPGGNFI